MDETNDKAPNGGNGGVPQQQVDVDAPKDEKKFESTVLKVYSEKEKGKGLVRLRIVKWGKYKPVFEKREFWFDAEDSENPGKEKLGKAKGLKLEDIEIIEDNLDEIKNFLKG